MLFRDIVISLFLQYAILPIQTSYSQIVADSTIRNLSQDTAIVFKAVTVEAYQVSGHLRTIPGNIAVLTSDGINISDGTNLADALNTLPGVTMQTGTFTTNRIVVRGMGSRTPYNTNRIKTYLNDIPLTTADGLSAPEEIEAQRMGRLELIKGPSSALYGSGLGGSLNLYTPANSENEGDVNIQYGSYDTWRVQLDGHFHPGKAAIWTNFNHFQSSGYRENNNYKRTSLISTVDLKRPRWAINSLILLSGVDAGIPSSLGKTLFESEPQSAAPNWKAIEGFKKYFRTVAGISLTNIISTRLVNKLGIFGRAVNSFEKRPFNNLDDQSISGGIRNKLSFHNDKTDMLLGIEWIIENYIWKLDTSDVIINRNSEFRNQINLFGIVYYRPGPKLSFSVAAAVNDIRFRLSDHYAGNGNQSGERRFPVIFSPRAGISFTPNNMVALYASAGHGFSLPSPEETLLPAGDINHNIRHEQGFQFELGLRLNMLNDHVVMDGTLYWIELKDLLLTKRISEDIFTGINAGRTRHQGIEFMLHSGIFNYTVFPGSLSAVFSYARSFNRFVIFSDEGNIYDGNQLPGIPKQTLYLRLQWKPINAIEFETEARYTGNQYLDDGNTMLYDGYFLCNMKLATTFAIKGINKLRVYAGMNNITDTHYASMLVVNIQGFNGSEPRYFYPGLPGNGYAGIQYYF